MRYCPEWWKRPRRISVVVDNESWALPYAERLICDLNETGDSATLCREYGQVKEGQVAFFIGCIGLCPGNVLDRNRYNLVVHESNLPEGRGFAPLTWAILSGANEVAACLIEASPDQADAGVVYFRSQMSFRGHELNDKLRARQGETTIELCRKFLDSELPPEGRPQVGTPSMLPRRRPSDSRLDPNLTIAEQFELLRVVDNDRYPAFFEFRGRRYTLRIEDAGPSKDKEME